MVLCSGFFGLYPRVHTSSSRQTEQPYQVQLHPPPSSWGAGSRKDLVLPSVSAEHSRHSSFCRVFLRLPSYLNAVSDVKQYWGTISWILVWKTGSKSMLKNITRNNGKGKEKRQAWLEVHLKQQLTEIA